MSILSVNMISVDCDFIPWAILFHTHCTWSITITVKDHDNTIIFYCSVFAHMSGTLSILHGMTHAEAIQLVSVNIRHLILQYMSADYQQIRKETAVVWRHNEVRISIYVINLFVSCIQKQSHSLSNKDGIQKR